MSQIDQIDKEIKLLYKEVSSRRWVQYTTGFDLGVTEAENKVKSFKQNPENYKIILEALNQNQSKTEKRKAQIWNSNFKDYHLSDRVKKIKNQIDELENQLMDAINKFRSQIDGKEVTSTEVSHILSQSPDRSLRQKAFESSLPLNQLVVDSGFLKLIDLRKELGVACGFNSFVDYKLDYEELNSDIFKNWDLICAERKEKFKNKSEALAQKYLNLENLMPWDQRYLTNKICSLNQATVDLSGFYDNIAKLFLKFGFDISKLNLTYDIFPRKNKSEWGYNFTIEMGKDSRILANVSNKFSDYWVLLHETAHGAHYMGLDEEACEFSGGISGIVSEGFANFMGNQCYSKEFLSEIFKDNTEGAYQEFSKLSSVTHLQNYRLVADIIFDQSLYSNNLKTADDIQELRQSIVYKSLGEAGYIAPWAKLIHHTSHPIYLHNYFLGDVMSENMNSEFSHCFEGKNPEHYPLEYGQFWKSKLLDPSGREPFLKLYSNVFGKDLSIIDYVDKKCLA